MRFAKPKFFLLAVLLGALPMAVVSACGGDAFEEAQGGGTAGNATTGGSSNSGGTGQRVACLGPDECDDADSCTIDACSGDGFCASQPKCEGTMRCCEGECAQCCENEHCDDGIACTDNTCFAGQCMFVPRNSACEANEFCSLTEGCKPRIPCDASTADTVCNDSSACTTDACVDGYCENQYCDTQRLELCCPFGCAECCVDAQCDRDDDPCTVGSCSEDGTCSVVPLCAAGQQCCPSADGKTALCGSCCSADECDDGVDCTEDKCGGGTLSCTNTASDALCETGEICHPKVDCQPKVDCSGDGDCTGGNCGRCEQGVCKYGCAAGSGTCCAATNTCSTCCGDASCNDNIACTVDTCGPAGCSNTPSDGMCPAGYICDPALGGCIQCKTNADCDDSSTCTTDTCNLQTHTCSYTNTCECKTSYDCQSVSLPSAEMQMTDRPIPIGTYCPTCVDGACKQVYCEGQCCPSGCSFLSCLE
jgi:hypothetical protein